MKASTIRPGTWEAGMWDAAALARAAARMSYFDSASLRERRYATARLLQLARAIEDAIAFTRELTERPRPRGRRRRA